MGVGCLRSGVEVMSRMLLSGSFATGRLGFTVAPGRLGFTVATGRSLLSRVGGIGFGLGEVLFVFLHFGVQVDEDGWGFFLGCGFLLYGCFVLPVFVTGDLGVGVVAAGFYVLTFFECVVGADFSVKVDDGEEEDFKFFGCPLFLGKLAKCFWVLSSSSRCSWYAVV